jgi:hypothetical protein
MDTTRLATYSEAYLQELRANAVKRVDAARFLVARGAIGGTRMHAMKDIEAGRAERDAIDAELGKRKPAEPAKSIEHVYADADPTDAAFKRMGEPLPALEEPPALALEADDDLMLDPPEVPRRSPEIRKPKR